MNKPHGCEKVYETANSSNKLRQNNIYSSHAKSGKTLPPEEQPVKNQINFAYSLTLFASCVGACVSQIEKDRQAITRKEKPICEAVRGDSSSSCIRFLSAVPCAGTCTLLQEAFGAFVANSRDSRNNEREELN